MLEFSNEIFSKNTLYLSIASLSAICFFIICVVIFYLIKDRFSRGYNKSIDTIENIKKIKRHIEQMSNITDMILHHAMDFIEDGDSVVLSVEDVKENFDHMKTIIEIQFKQRFGHDRLPFKFLWCSSSAQANKLIPEITKRGAFLKAAICDMDLGSTGGDINDVIKELASRSVPTIIYTGYEKNEFEKKILPELKAKVIYQYKGYNKEMAEILEHLVEGKLEIVK